MTKISKKAAYPIKKPIKSDYFIGTDSENFNKTVNFDFEDATAVINELNGQSVIGYQFKTSYNIPLSVLEEAEFYSLGNETTISDITKLYVNKFTKNSLNLSNLYNYLLVNSGDFLFKLQGTDPNVYVYFNLASIENHSDYYVFNVTLYKGNSVLPELINFGEYFFNFELKSTGGGVGTDIYNRLDALENKVPSDYAKIVYVNSYSPNLATIFDLNNPPTVNDNLLKEDVNNLYIANDTGSTWTWNTLINGYVTKSIPSSSNFFLKGTATDAGSNKNSSIHRTGHISAGNLSGTNTGDQDLTPLQNQINAINILLASDNINLDNVQELVDAIENVQTSLATILVNDLTTGGTTKALTAQMGVTIKGLIDALALVVADKVDKATGKSLILDTEIVRLASVANYVEPPTAATITTTASITSATLTDVGHTQNGKIIKIDNGANVINYTVNGLTASFVKGGTGAITFVQGAGRTLTGANGTLIFNGAVNSSASIVSNGTIDTLYINNL